MRKVGKWSVIVLGSIVLAFALYLAPFIVLMPTAPVPLTAIDTLEDLDRLFASMVAQDLPPALDIAIQRNGEMVFSRAYGVADGITGEKATPRHVYHYWSMTKTFTAVAVLQLIESGKVSVEAPITTYLPQFVPIDQSGNPVEVRVAHLLNHSSGLPDFTFEMFQWVHAIDEPRFGETRMVNERLTAYRTVTHKPGSESHYRNINYVLLGAIIEAVTDGTYEDYVRSEILIPLNMRDTDFVYRPDMRAVRGTLAHYTYYTPILALLGPDGGIDGLTVKRVDDVHWLHLVYTDYAASTSLIGTGVDLVQFGQMLLNGGELGGVRILSEESARSVLYGGRLSTNGADAVLGNGTKSWLDHGVELVGHGGGGPGFTLQYLLIPEKNVVIVVLTNSTIVDAFELSRMIGSTM